MGTIKTYFERADPAQRSELSALNPLQRRALLEVLALAVYADGFAAVEELDVFLEIAHELPGFNQRSDERLEAMMEDAAGRLRRVTSPAAAQAMLTHIAAVLADTHIREAAFGLAAAIAFCDGVMANPEKRVLQSIARAFALPSARADELIQHARTMRDHI